jgi:hypothetical protein
MFMFQKFKYIAKGDLWFTIPAIYSKQKKKFQAGKKNSGFKKIAVEEFFLQGFHRV